MLFPRSSARMTMVTEEQVSDRNIAACPAEFPPPTTITGAASHWRRSISVAA